MFILVLLVACLTWIMLDIWYTHLSLKWCCLHKEKKKERPWNLSHEHKSYSFSCANSALICLMLLLLNEKKEGVVKIKQQKNAVSLRTFRSRQLRWRHHVRSRKSWPLSLTSPWQHRDQSFAILHSAPLVNQLAALTIRSTLFLTAVKML